MKPFSLKTKLRSTILKIGDAPLFRIVWFFLGVIILFSVAAAFFLPLFQATQTHDYFDCVSELRSNVLIAQTDEFTLRAYAVEKEHPYVADGVKREITKRAEVYLTAPSGEELCSIHFTVNGQSYGGEMSYDNVKEEYFFSVSAPISELSALDCQIEYGDRALTLHAVTVKNSNTLSARIILDKLRENEIELFNSLTDEHGFVGEIYIRLISEGEPYYYVGLITKDGKTRAFLLAADTGRVLAKRES